MNQTGPLVSIISAYYNRQDWVEDSIKSLFAQTYSNIEIIIVDDGSTDGTLDRLMSMGDPRYRVISQENTGIVGALNRAIRESRGQYVAIHGSGDISFPDRIAKQVEVLESRKSIGIVSCRSRYYNRVTGDSAVRRAWLPSEGDHTTILMRMNCLGHGEVMFRRELFDLVGGYRDFFTFSQDYDLWLRMSRHAGVYVIPEVLYQKYTLPGGVSASLDKVVQQVYLGDFARQCIEERDVSGTDYIDRYGARAAFFRRRTRNCAIGLASVAQRAFLTGDLPRARKTSRLSLGEKLTLKGLILYVLASITSRSPELHRTVLKQYHQLRSAKSLLRKLFGGRPT